MKTRHKVVVESRNFWNPVPINCGSSNVKSTGRYWYRGGAIWVELMWPTWFGLSSKRSFFHEDCFTFESYTEFICEVIE